jgi:hypothetical protein
LVAHLIEHRGLADQADWQRLHWGDPERFRVFRDRVPREVDSVANYHKTGRSVLTVVVAGGVRAEPSSWLAPDQLSSDENGELTYVRGDSAAKPQMPLDVWWWDG